MAQREISKIRVDNVSSSRRRDRSLCIIDGKDESSTLNDSYGISEGFALIFVRLNKVASLEALSISKSSARQRQGRAGRLSDGVCYRLYTKECFDLMQEQNDPKILPENLAGNLLNVIKGGRNPRTFRWLEIPSEMAQEQAFGQLPELDTIDVDDEITPLGRHMSSLTLDPRCAKAVLTSIEEGVVDEVVTLAAILNIGYIIQIPHAPEALTLHARATVNKWKHKDGDVFSCS